VETGAFLSLLEKIIPCRRKEKIIYYLPNKAQLYYFLGEFIFFKMTVNNLFTIVPFLLFVAFATPVISVAAVKTTH
jgi:hypothetical protein